MDDIMKPQAPTEAVEEWTDDGKPHKTWFYTLNNWTTAELTQLKLMTEVTRHRCCAEVGESGTPHLQGIIVFPKAYRFSALKKLWPRAYIVVPKSFEHSWNYCTKGEMMIDINNSRQGKRTDLEQVFDMLVGGSTIQQVIREHPGTYMRTRQGIRATMADMIEPRTSPTEVHIRWGPTGSGKTRYIWDNFPMNKIYEKSPGKWWDGYAGQEIVLIDDFVPENSYDISWEWWLKLMDRYPMQVEFKGGWCQFNSKVIYITSNFSPTRWFREHENRAAFLRRVATITHVRGDGFPPVVTTGLGETVTVTEVA